MPVSLYIEENPLCRNIFSMSEIVTYSEDDFSLPVKIESGSVWLTQAQIVALFQRDKSVVSRHINNVFAEQELQRASTVANFATVQMEGGREVVRNIEYYNLDVIISVGYRVKSLRGTKFRQWATSVLREHLLRGFTVKQPVSAEQLSDVKDKIQALEHKVNEMLQQQDKADSFMYEEFGRVYEIISGITEQKRLQGEQARRRIGYELPHENQE